MCEIEKSLCEIGKSLREIRKLLYEKLKLLYENAPGQEGITGVILHRLFKNKPIYVRPNRVLLPDLSEVRFDETRLHFLCSG